MRGCGPNGTPNPKGPGPRTQQNPDAVPQGQTALPTRLLEHLEDRTGVGTVKVLAQEETRRGFLPLLLSNRRSVIIRFWKKWRCARTPGVGPKRMAGFCTLADIPVSLKNVALGCS